MIPDVNTLLDKLLAIATLNDASVSNNTVLTAFKAPAPPKTAPNTVEQAPRPSKAEQNLLLKRIGELESIVDDYLSYDTVSELVSCYGKATEYFSDDPNSDYMIFTVKTQSLLARPEIQAVLDSNRNVPLLDMVPDTAQPAATNPQPTKPTTTSSMQQDLLSLNIEPSPQKPVTKQRFMFAEDDDMDPEDAKDEPLPPPPQPPQPQKQEIDLMGLDILPPKQTTEVASTPEKKEVNKVEDLFDAPIGKLSDKLVKRKKPADQEKTMDDPISSPEEKSPTKTEENELTRLTRIRSSASGKKATSAAVVVKKDSFSDEENKFVIG